MAFRFSLAAVLRYRESLERREELALQAILADMGRTSRQIERLTAELARAHQTLNQVTAEPVPASQVQSMFRETEAIATQKKALIDSLAELDRRRRAQTAVYQAANRNRQMLSDMASRQREEYDAEIARRHQKSLDEIFAARAHRE